MSASEHAETSPAARPLVRKTLVYRLIRNACVLYLALRHRMRVEGRRHVPEEGGALIVANHQSYLDIPLIAASLDRHVCFVARRSLADSKVLAFVMRQCGAVLIDRGSADRVALREIADHLAAGDLVVIFGEGTRTHDGSVGEFKGGARLIARKSPVPLIPASIHGSWEIWPRGRRLPGGGRIGVRYAAAVAAGAADALERVREKVIEGLEHGRPVEPALREGSGAAGRER